MKLELQKQFNLSGKKIKLFILTKLFRPNSFVSLHAQLVTRNEITTTILNTPSDFHAYELGGVMRYKNLYIHSLIFIYVKIVHWCLFFCASCFDSGVIQAISGVQIRCHTSYIIITWGVICLWPLRSHYYKLGSKT